MMLQSMTEVWWLLHGGHTCYKSQITRLYNTEKAIEDSRINNVIYYSYSMLILWKAYRL